MRSEDRNRQVFRCVMFDMFTQHPFITGGGDKFDSSDSLTMITLSLSMRLKVSPASKAKYGRDDGILKIKITKKKCSWIGSIFF